jgi:hypothetical protein
LLCQKTKFAFLTGSLSRQYLPGDLSPFLVSELVSERHYGANGQVPASFAQNMQKAAILTRIIITISTHKVVCVEPAGSSDARDLLIV